MHNSDQTKAFFDGCAAMWDEMCTHDPLKLSAIVTLAGIKPGDLVADIACGTGIMLPEILGRSPREIVGVDLSDKMIECAQKKLHDPRIRLVASDIFDFGGTGFDVAMVYSAYPHFPDKAAFFTHIAKMLKSGGRLMIAHGESRHTINARHSGEKTRNVSVSLRAASEEARECRGLFDMDILIDTPELYVISGIKR